MPFEYGCFISYAHDDGERIQQFIEGFTDGLKSALGGYLGPEQKYWIDEDRLSGGYAHGEEIARRMCQSACWVLVYVPRYRRQPWCRREYRAMRALDQARRATLGRRIPQGTAMIIPVLLGGHVEDLPTSLPPKVFIETEFQKFNVGQQRIVEHPDFQPRMTKIAQRIWDVWRICEDLEEPSGCEHFSLPEDSTEDWGPEKGGPGQGRPL